MEIDMGQYDGCERATTADNGMLERVVGNQNEAIARIGDLECFVRDIADRVLGGEIESIASGEAQMDAVAGMAGAAVETSHSINVRLNSLRRQIDRLNAL